MCFHLHVLSPEFCETCHHVLFLYGQEVLISGGELYTSFCSALFYFTLPLQAEPEGSLPTVPQVTPNLDWILPCLAAELAVRLTRHPSIGEL